MTCKQSLKMSQESISFLDKANTNMIRAEVIDKAISRPDVLDRVVKYFKLNNGSYKEFINMENENNGS